jgi:hypothetical protein
MAIREGLYLLDMTASFICPANLNYETKEFILISLLQPLTDPTTNRGQTFISILLLVSLKLCVDNTKGMIHTSGVGGMTRMLLSP